MGQACLYCHWSLPNMEKTELITCREPNWNQLLKTMKSVHSCISPICGEGRCHSLSCCGPLFNQSALDIRFHHSGCVTCCRVFGGLQCKHICIRWIPLSIASAQSNNYPNRAEVLCHKLNIKVCLFVCFFYQKMSLSHKHQVTTNLKKCVSWKHFWVEQSKQTSPDQPFSGYFLQLVQRDTVVFPVCYKTLPPGGIQERPWTEIKTTWTWAKTNVKKKQLYTSFFWMTEFLMLSLKYCLATCRGKLISTTPIYNLIVSVTIHRAGGMRVKRWRKSSHSFQICHIAALHKAYAWPLCY